jgi:hypothetical protein
MDWDALRLDSGLVEDGRATSGGVGRESSKSFGGFWAAEICLSIRHGGVREGEWSEDWSMGEWLTWRGFGAAGGGDGREGSNAGRS